jgi:hypothetical protein
VPVDSVCLRDMTLNDVLAAHRWSTFGAHREALRTALCKALDRMMGAGRGGPQHLA